MDEETEAPGEDLEAYDPASDDGEGDGGLSGILCNVGNATRGCGT